MLCSRCIGVALFAATMGLAVVPTHAAVVTTSQGWSANALSANFTTEGTKDWVIWDSSNNPTSLTVMNRKTGTASISNLSVIGTQSSGTGGNNAAIWDSSLENFSPGLTFSYTNGVSPATKTEDSPGAAFKRWYGNVWNSQVIFDVPVTASSQTLELYIATVNGAWTGVKTSFDNGATFSAVTDNAQTTGNRTGTFKFVYSDPVATTMKVYVTQSSSYQHASNYLILGGATLVPEPASMALAGLGGLALLARRRRVAVQ